MRLSRDPAARRRLAALGAAAAAALVIGIAVGSGAGDIDDEGGGEAAEPSAPAEAEGERRQAARRAVDRLSLRRQVGQLLISSFDETTLPDYMHRRLRARETAGVILFGRNGGDEAHWRALTRSIQEAAGGRALVMVDQEGGDIRTADFAGPAAGQATQGDAAAVRSAAREAAGQLDGVGINVNLAPVADVSDRGGQPSVMDGRAFTGPPDAVAAATRASIRGMREAGVAATAKHFPGLGGSTVNTDDAPATVPGDVAGDLVPFEAAVAEDVPLIMLSHALYPALDANEIASQSQAIATRLLREELGFEGVAVTDSMEAQAVLARHGVADAAERSIRAGADLLLLTGSASWNEVFPRLLEEAQASPAFRERVRESAARVLALGRGLLG
jgi:beta-N-acetylhexosaminidase